LPLAWLCTGAAPRSLARAWLPGLGEAAPGLDGARRAPLAVRTWRSVHGGAGARGPLRGVATPAPAREMARRRTTRSLITRQRWPWRRPGGWLLRRGTTPTRPRRGRRLVGLLHLRRLTTSSLDSRRWSSSATTPTVVGALLSRSPASPAFVRGSPECRRLASSCWTSPPRGRPFPTARCCGRPSPHAGQAAMLAPFGQPLPFPGCTSAASLAAGATPLPRPPKSPPHDPRAPASAPLDPRACGRAPTFSP
jgi:hypothetical protein